MCSSQSVYVHRIAVRAQAVHKAKVIQSTTGGDVRHPPPPNYWQWDTHLQRLKDRLCQGQKDIVVYADVVLHVIHSSE